jgi:small-conductance mechanosensitive channel
MKSEYPIKSIKTELDNKVAEERQNLRECDKALRTINKRINSFKERNKQTSNPETMSLIVMMLENIQKDLTGAKGKIQDQIDLYQRTYELLDDLDTNHKPNDTPMWSFQ